MVVRSCLLLVAASVVSAQFLDFSSFSLFPGSSNQRVPNFPDYFQRQASSSYEEHDRQSTTRRPVSTSFHYDDSYRDRSTTRRPQSTSYNYEDSYRDRSTTRRPQSTSYNYEDSYRDRSTTRRPQSTSYSYYENNRQTQTTRKQSRTTSKPFSFASFIDVPSSSDNRQFFSSQRNDQSSQGRTSSFHSNEDANPRVIFNQVTDSNRRTDERNPYDNRGSRVEVTNRPQEERNPYNRDFTTRRPQETRNPYDEYVRSQENPDYTINEYNYGGDKQTNTNRQNVRPSIDENRDPITNKPPRVDGFIFREDDAPEMITGPDEELLSDEKKRRVLQIADRMCARFAAESTDSVAAIPLLPSPAPVTVAVQRCTPDTVPLVVGGQVVAIQQHPHMAAVGWPNLRGGGYSWKCGGTLVSERYVLTAAHCSYQDRDNTVVQGPPRVVQLGSARLSDPEATMARVAAVVRHPNYKSPSAYYDIALLRLAASVRFSDRIRPACVGEPPPPGESIIATGWGRTEFGGAMSQQLRGVSLPVWEISECARALGTSRKLPRGAEPRAQMCAGELRGGKDTCQGDSGGPAVVGSPCLWRVVGVTSLGRACGAPRTPALYARALPAFVAAVVWL